MVRGRKDRAPKGCRTLSEACAMVLQMTVPELEGYEPRTMCERIAFQYAARANRGDDNAFNVLATTADAAITDGTFEDALSAALRELADEMERERASGGVRMCPDV